MSNFTKTFEIPGRDACNDLEVQLTECGVTTSVHQDAIDEFIQELRDHRNSYIGVTAVLYTATDGVTSLVSLKMNGTRSEEAEHAIGFYFRPVKGKVAAYTFDTEQMDRVIGYVCARHGCQFIEPGVRCALDAIKVAGLSLTIQFKINRSLRVITGFTVL